MKGVRYRKESQLTITLVILELLILLTADYAAKVYLHENISDELIHEELK